VGFSCFGSLESRISRPHQHHPLESRLHFPPYQLLKAQAGLEVKLEGKTLDGKPFSSSSSVDVVAKVKAPIVRLMVADDEMILEDDPTLQTPFTDTVTETAVRYIWFKSSDVGQAYTATIPVSLLDEKGQIIPITSNVGMKIDDSNWQNGSIGMSSGSAKFVNGIAQIPVTVRPSATMLEMPKFDVVKFSATTSSASSGAHLQGLGDTLCLLNKTPTYKDEPSGGIPSDSFGRYFFDWYLFGNGKPLKIRRDNPKTAALVSQWKKYMEQRSGAATMFNNLNQFQCQLIAIALGAANTGSCEIPLTRASASGNLPYQLNDYKLCDYFGRNGTYANGGCNISGGSEDFFSGRGWINT
jgi:hypothetical protein